jgi:hypothetical protein
MKSLKKKLFVKKTTVANLNEIEQRMIKGGWFSNEISCFGNTCWETCIPDNCTYVSLEYCTEITC